MVRFEQSVDVAGVGGSGSHIVGVGGSGSQMHEQEQEQEQEHRRIDNDKTATTATTTQRQRRLPLRQRRRRDGRSASDPEMQKGSIPGEHSSRHSRKCRRVQSPRGSATHASGPSAGVGQVGALTDGARPATQKGIIPGGLITPCVCNCSRLLDPEPLGNGQCGKVVPKSSPSLGSFRQPPVI